MTGCSTLREIKADWDSDDISLITPQIIILNSLVGLQLSLKRKHQEGNASLQLGLD